MTQIIEFATNHPYLVGLAFVLTILLFMNEARQVTRKGLDLSPSQIVALMNNGAKVIDVRSHELYRAGHILNATHIAFDDLDAKAEKALKAHKDKVVVVYCDHGAQSAKASAMLRQLNIKAVSLKGGLSAWIKENMPIEKGK